MGTLGFMDASKERGRFVTISSRTLPADSDNRQDDIVRCTMKQRTRLRARQGNSQFEVVHILAGLPDDTLKYSVKVC